MNHRHHLNQLNKVYSDFFYMECPGVHGFLTACQPSGEKMLSSAPNFLLTSLSFRFSTYLGQVYLFFFTN